MKFSKNKNIILKMIKLLQSSRIAVVAGESERVAVKWKIKTQGGISKEAGT